MVKDSPEYLAFKEKYEADLQYREDHPELFPWFSYHVFGFHSTRSISDEEKEEEKRFYHLIERSDGSCFRYGRQPIEIVRRINK